MAHSKRSIAVGWALLLSFQLLRSFGAVEYRDHSALTEQLNRLASEHGKLVRLQKAAVTAGGRELWLVELGTGSDDERIHRPAMLVVAGIEGNDLVGTASVMYWIDYLASNYGNQDALRRLLDSTTIYVFPRVNPDAAESFFARPKVERTGNNTPVDDDHDGLIDEDGPEDLNGDGLVTWMRVEDPEGEYILDPADPRLLIKADKGKGEKGAWKLYTEGIDNDKDDQWNEDGPGGVNLNRNFPFNYQFFAPWAGPHQVSEVETRALADFLGAHPNIGLAFTFGAADNLVQTPKSEPGGKRPPTAISEADVPYYRELGRLYREALGLKKELTGTNQPGTLSDWIYFHRGRLSLAAQPWTPEMELELAKSRKAEEEKPKDATTKKDENAKAQSSNEQKDDKPKPDSPEVIQADAKKKEKPSPEKRGEEERAVLKWFDENAPEGFVAWKDFKHPDFPGKKVEIGGWAPFTRSNPPLKLLEPLAKNHAKFLTDLAGKLPRIGFRKAETKSLGNGVYELTLEVENTGYLPTALAQGALTREVLRTRVVLKLEDKQILAGQRMTLLGPIEGSGGAEELRYIVRATAPVEIELISALGGSMHRTVELKEAQ